MKTKEDTCGAAAREMRWRRRSGEGSSLRRSSPEEEENQEVHPGKVLRKADRGQVCQRPLTDRKRGERIELWL